MAVTSSTIMRRKGRQRLQSASPRVWTRSQSARASSSQRSSVRFVTIRHVEVSHAAICDQASTSLRVVPMSTLTSTSGPLLPCHRHGHPHRRTFRSHHHGKAPQMPPASSTNGSGLVTHPTISERLECSSGKWTA